MPTPDELFHQRLEALQRQAAFISDEHLKASFIRCAELLEECHQVAHELGQQIEKSQSIDMSLESAIDWSAKRFEDATSGELTPAAQAGLQILRLQLNPPPSGDAATLILEEIHRISKETGLSTDLLLAQADSLRAGVDVYLFTGKLLHCYLQFTNLYLRLLYEDILDTHATKLERKQKIQAYRTAIAMLLDVAPLAAAAKTMLSLVQKLIDFGDFWQALVSDPDGLAQINFVTDFVATLEKLLEEWPTSARVLVNGFSSCLQTFGVDEP